MSDPCSTCRLDDKLVMCCFKNPETDETKEVRIGREVVTCCPSLYICVPYRGQEDSVFKGKVGALESFCTCHELKPMSCRMYFCDKFYEVDDE